MSTATKVIEIQGEDVQETVCEIDVTAVAAQIKALAAKYSDHYAWGVRMDKPGLPVGHTFKASRVWVDGRATRRKLAGTACIDNRHLHLCRNYTGQPYIVCGLEAGYGEDAGEILMTECEIMAVIE